ncbi:FtsW/RodA/SpoVE family cell cycle protein [Enterococcus durans]|uniref:Probable peptidoglycan glycosyltransferase FtsW n=1 Tax=Enterococcus durans TaxID=53345 RepID=A0A5N0YUR8_9ENTE|nr:FtsW/RodA/SpoVE family cell cycle protein [Enterococcus durans]KAA9180217.1 FtsW/RodA/SpoVE family cell cycle protein [Enterococcus durans]KAA9187343.1 FtsW/RodA/SpoVE family cell cycle protein [Enterococcus durans]KAA9187512.1 FtsW/RodA/SpoVE family cell cycle protein [Enterococcus durans]KAA9192327.1 FtsW/RodA/SpoVE family cell cycle protein [Enterococcus durans]KAA9194644.1 FtsW/RodA/SpoVE family cell cycle protein [Enterococcus durans]
MWKNRKIDWLILGPYMALSIVGLLEIYSASSYRLLVTQEDPKSLFVRQFCFILLSWCMIAFTFSVRLHILLKPKQINYGIMVSILLLLMMKVGLFAVTVNGAQRWISIGGIQFQPSELGMIFLILYLSRFFRDGEKVPDKIHRPLMLVSTMALLVLFQPKIAGAIMILTIAGAMIWAAAIPIKKGVVLIFSSVAGLVLMAGLVVLFEKHGVLPSFFEHAYSRIAMVHDPFLDEHGAGYQMSNSYYTLYNGGLFGRGLGNSITKKGYLPESETDFIFSIIAEEFGLIGALLVLLLLFLMCFRIFQRSVQSQNQQASLILIGVGTWLLTQTSINVGSVLGLIPMTGVPLPFVSYGGTSYFILSFAVGLSLNITSRQTERKKQVDELQLDRPKVLKKKN